MKLLLTLGLLIALVDFVQSASYEQDCVNLVNKFRQSKGLAAVPFSPTLSVVAAIHARDQNNKGKLSHDWFGTANSGSPPACILNGNGNCMWKKPSEITSCWTKPYTSNSYENSHGGPGWTATPISAVSGWINSGPHSNVILNKDIWTNYKWKALGCGFYGGFANLWFGDTTDANPISSSLKGCKGGSTYGPWTTGDTRPKKCATHHYCGLGLQAKYDPKAEIMCPNGCTNTICCNRKTASAEVDATEILDPIDPNEPEPPGPGEGPQVAPDESLTGAASSLHVGCATLLPLIVALMR